MDNKQIKLHKQRVKEALTYDVYEREYDGIRISQMLWGSYFINLRIIEVGRLQYELSLFNPVTKKKEKVIKIHIPKGSKLDVKLVLSSLKESKNKIEYYFNVKNPKYYCESWLLSKEIMGFVNDDSNIAKFYDLFNILKEENGINDVLNFVFGVVKCDDYKTLHENTSLQKNVKKALLDGVIINIGIGKLKEDIL